MKRMASESTGLDDMVWMVENLPFLWDNEQRKFECMIDL